GSLPFTASNEEANAWIDRQQGRHAEGAGFSFAIVWTAGNRAVGHCGLWLRDLSSGLATAGYAIAPLTAEARLCRGHPSGADRFRMDSARTRSDRPPRRTLEYRIAAHGRTRRIRAAGSDSRPSDLQR